MTITRTAAAVAICVGAWSAASSPATADQDALARAKALYTSAAYDEALALLDQFDHTSTKDDVEVDQYRAFCLLALGRSDDARKVIQEIVEMNPTFQPSESQLSPRLLDAFRDVRQRVLPSIVRQTYADAKAAFDRRDFELAGSLFNSVIMLLDDKDTKGASELADLRLLSNGFLELINKMPRAAAPPVQAIAPPETPPAPPGLKVYDARDADVTPPVPVSQIAPAWRPARQDSQTYDGTLTLEIDEHGAVTSVGLQGNLQPDYAALLRRAASQWKYQPARLKGVAVKYRRTIGIHLAPVDAKPGER